METLDHPVRRWKFFEDRKTGFKLLRLCIIIIRSYKSLSYHGSQQRCVSFDELNIDVFRHLVFLDLIIWSNWSNWLNLEVFEVDSKHFETFFGIFVADEIYTSWLHFIKLNAGKLIKGLRLTDCHLPVVPDCKLFRAALTIRLQKSDRSTGHPSLEVSLETFALIC